ncbi:MAG: hypothetical protein KJ017_05505 [Alphaproteobacteria bacterium]|nr:hypothetical protein [Alphaproteobacteria bacterium]
MLNKKPRNTLLKTLAVKLFLAPTMVFAFILISSFSVAQSSPTVIEVKDEEELKDLKALDNEAQRLLNERKICKTTAQDYKQECLCNKHEEYIEFYKKTDKIVNSPSRGIWFRAILSYEDNGQTKRTSAQRFSQIYLDFEMSCFRNDDGTFRANHEWDKPELAIKSSQDAKDLYSLYSYEKKVSIAVHKCSFNGQHSESDCNCAYKEKRQLILKRALHLDKTHPEWKNYVLMYHYNGQTFRTSWEEVLRHAHENSSVCMK